MVIKRADDTRKTLKDILFFLALNLYCAHVMLANITLYYEMPEIINPIRKVIKYIIFGLICVKMFYADRFNKKTILYYIAIVVSVLLEYLTGRYSSLILAFGLIICCYDIDFEKIVKTLFRNIVIWGLCVVALCKMGFLDDYTYVHRIGSVSRTAHSLGFLAYNHLGFMIMAASMMWIYLRKNCSHIELALIVVINYLLYTIHTTTLSLIIVYGFIALYLIVVKWDFFSLKSKLFKLAATMLPTFICLLTGVLLFFFAAGRFSINISFLNTIAKRFEYSEYYLGLYGIHMFGQKIEMNSIQQYYYGTADNSIYIDSGYIYSLIAYGIIFTVIILICYTVIFRYVYKENNKALYVWIAVIMAACCVNNFLLNLVFNPILFLLPKALLNDRKVCGNLINKVP